MPRVSPDDVIRHFRENGLKLLLHSAANVRDLLGLRDPARAARIDFERLTIDATSYVAADYRHLCSDLVVRVPYRTRLEGRWRTLTLYILIEHQSAPDPLMLLRVLEYLVQIYKGQVRKPEEKKRRGGSHNFRLQPVLPIVFYTGERRWDALTPFAELVAGGDEDFADVLPQLRPVFLNLSAIPPAELEQAGGAFGWVLELLRQRHASPADFRTTTERVTNHLEGMAESERERWLLFLSYIEALVYHDRPTSEHAPLRELILDCIRSDARRREVESMWESMADYVRKKGRKEEALHSRQQILLRQLRRRFGRLPAAVKQEISASTDIARLDQWLNNFATAQTLADVGIAAPSGS
jgi:hypothetical protein